MLLDAMSLWAMRILRRGIYKSTAVNDRNGKPLFLLMLLTNAEMIFKSAVINDTKWLVPPPLNEPV